MLDEREAANHCGRKPRQFMVECPVQPVRFPNGDTRYDVRDLDTWLDGLKAGNTDDADAIVERLGS
jgi:hypothetical protein